MSIGLLVGAGSEFLLQVFRVAVPISLSYAQQVLRSLRMLKIPCAYFRERRPADGGWHGDIQTTRDSNRPTPRVSLSGTFLQTLPELVTPLKGHSLSPRSCPPRLSAPSEGFGTNKTTEATQRPCTHVNLRHVRPRLGKSKRKKKRVPSWVRRFWFYLCWCK